MKTLNNFSKLALATLLAIAAMTGCRESADLTGDPTPVVVPYTFTPSHGYPGTEVLIAGANFSNVTSVSFGVKQAEIIQKSDSQISVYVPVGALSGEIKIVSKGIVIASAIDFVVDNSPIPTIISFSPAIVGSNETVTIAGSLLNIVDSVYVGELKAVLDEATQTASELSFVTPVGLQSGKIRLFYDYETDYGMTKPAETKSETDLSLKLPTIESISPDIATLNVGDELIIVGTMLDKVTSVKFGTIEADLATATVTATEMKLKVPVGATTGKMTFAVTDGTIEHASDFTVNLPAIASFFPFKGAEIIGGVRDITLSGTKMDLVTSATIGTSSVTILSQNETNLTIRISGSQSGIITLNTNNGPVKSVSPFIITGDFWVVDFDNTYDPSRYSSFDANTVTNGSNTVETGGPTGSYGHSTGTTVIDKRPRVYIRSTDGGGFTVPDGFMLYTSNPKGVFVSCDVNIKNIPAELVNGDGTVDLELYLFSSRVGSAAPNPPYGFSKVIKIPYVAGNNNWVHINEELSTFKEDTDLEGTATTGSAGGLRPDRLRLFTLFFVKSATTTSLMEVNFDNVKFTIN